jgi:uncharacterized protein YfaS (alpha-2-macroglobulin family)
LFVIGGKRGIRVAVNTSMSLDIIAISIMANVQAGFYNPKTNGVQVLTSMLQREGDSAWWASSHGDNRFGARGTPSIMAVRAFLMGGGDMEIARAVIRTMRDRRTSEQWYNTFATAQTLEAFALFAEREAETVSATGATISANDTILGNIKFDATNAVETVDLTFEDIAPSGDIVVASADDAPVYSTVFARLFRTDRFAQAVSRGMTLTRSYANADTSKSTIDIGDMVNVTLSVSGSGIYDGQKYLVIEDKLPAGMIPVNENLDNVVREKHDNARNYIQNYAHREYTKSGIILSREYIDSDTLTFHYRARVVSSGSFAVPPATATLMYSPDIYARTSSEVMEIVENSAIKFQSNTLRATSAKVANIASKYGSWIAGGLVALAIGIILFTKPWRRTRKS